MQFIPSESTLQTVVQFNRHIYIMNSSQIPLQTVVQLIPAVHVIAVVGHHRIARHQRVLRADVEAVVDLPVHVAHLSGGVEEPL